MRTTATWLLTLLTLAPLAALADDATAPAPARAATPTPTMNVWTGKGQVGFLDSQGNSPAKSANAALDMSYLTTSWKHTLHLDGLYGESANITSAERLDALWQSNYNISKDLFAFGNLTYRRDLFDGFQYQGSGSAGVGYKLLQTQSTTLSVQLGAGYMLSRPELLTKDAAGEVTERSLLPSQDYAVATAGLNYTEKLTATTSLSDQLLINAGSVNTLITNALALAVKVSNKLALSVGYDIQDNTSPPPRTKSLDTMETVNLVFSF
ncbi:MAG: DUF481 domain-containing protein [Steroidobacteraceae bacterium]